MKTQNDYIKNLKENIEILEEAVSWLKRSYTKCLSIEFKKRIHC